MKHLYLLILITVYLGASDLIEALRTLPKAQETNTSHSTQEIFVPKEVQKLRLKKPLPDIQTCYGVISSDCDLLHDAIEIIHVLNGTQDWSISAKKNEEAQKIKHLP